MALSAEKAGISTQLTQFRAGDLGLIAVEKLETDDPAPSKAAQNRLRLSRKRFFQQIREATLHLQTAVSGTLARLQPEVGRYQRLGADFWAEFGKEGAQHFDPHSLTLRGRPQGPEQTRRHERVVAGLRRVAFDGRAGDGLESNREGLARGLALSLARQRKPALTKSELLNLPIPVGEAESARWSGIVAAHAEDVLVAEMRDRLAELDGVVGAALGLDAADIAEIQRDLAEDSFLRGIRPRYPGTVTRKQGFRTGLDSEDRYE